MKLNFFHFIFFTLLITLLACNNNRWDADVEAVEVDLNFQRFDLELINLSDQPLTKSDFEGLKQKYPDFAPLYVEGIMKFGGMEEKESLFTFNRFLADSDMQELFEAVNKKFPEGSLKEEVMQLEKAFKRYHHYFPERQLPELRTFISAFTFSTVAADGLLGIGLDTYLGADFEIYSKIGIPQYKFKHFSPEYVVSDAMKAWLITEFETPGGKNLLEQMVFQGKILYLLRAFLADLEEHLFLNYGPDELKWCKNNEEQIWFHFIEMQLLHTTDNDKIRKYLGDAPFIAGFPEGSPGRVGQWIGLQIVEAYMDNNKEISLKDLMGEENADHILQHSKYKPKK